MENFYARVMDGVDVETFFICEDEAEGRRLMLGLLRQMGFTDTDVVFAQHVGPGARVRGRAYVHRPAAAYQWLDQPGAKE
jgi:hypothetical protein